MVGGSLNKLKNTSYVVEQPKKLYIYPNIKIDITEDEEYIVFNLETNVQLENDMVNIKSHWKTIKESFEVRDFYNISEPLQAYIVKLKEDNLWEKEDGEESIWDKV